MNRKLRINGTLERMVPDVYSAIYMEVQITALPKGKRDPKPIWHLEDESIPTLALCGFNLHGTCKSVSPALAMLGTPCPDCTFIVAEWLSSAIEERTKERRFLALLGTDLNFRGSVKKILPPELFLAKYVEPSTAQKVLANPNSSVKAKTIANRVIEKETTNAKVTTPNTRQRAGARKVPAF